MTFDRAARFLFLSSVLRFRLVPGGTLLAERTRDPRTGRYLNPGGFASPPAGAPHEVTTPTSISQSEIEQAHARAEERANQRADGGPQAGSSEGAPRREALGSPLPQQPIQILGKAPARSSESPDDTASPLDELTDAFKATHPAASTSDSPSRGVPTPSGDPGKQITGGWGPTGSGSEYFALNGVELKAIVVVLATRLKESLDGDLRFGLSVVYPQVKVSLRLTVDGRSPEGRDLDLPGTEKLDLQWDRILSLDAEVEDSEQTPAGKIRDDFHIRGPAKTIVRAGAARMLVDVTTDRTDAP